METKKAPWIRRFHKPEILLHWMHAIPFLILLGTGFYLAWEGFEGEERDKMVSSIHEYVGVLLIALPPLVFIFSRSRFLLRDIKEIFSFGKDDLQWMINQPLRKHGPPMGKFNTGQKFNSIAVLGYSFILQGTGIWLWMTPQGLLPRWSHTLMAFVACFLLMGHIFMAVVNPSTRTGFMGIINGWVPRKYMEEHHELQLQEIEEGEDDQRF